MQNFEFSYYNRSRLQYGFKGCLSFYDSEKHLYLNSFPGAKSVNLHSINVLQTVLAGDGDFKSEQAAFGLIHTNGAFQSLAFQRTCKAVRRNKERDGYRLNLAARNTQGLQPCVNPIFVHPFRRTR